MELKAALEASTREAGDLSEQLMRYGKQNAKLEIQLQEYNSLLDQMSKAKDDHDKKHRKLKDDHHSLLQKHEEQGQELSKTVSAMRMSQDNVVKLNKEVMQFGKVRENYDKKLKHMENDKAKVGEDRDKLRQIYANMEREVEAMKKQQESDKRNLENLLREKDILNKNILRHQGQVSRLTQGIIVYVDLLLSSCVKGSHKTDKDPRASEKKAGRRGRDLRLGGRSTKKTNWLDGKRTRSAC